MQLFSHEPASHHVVVKQLETRYDALIASGQKQPFVYPSMAFGALVVITYLCIDHRSRPWLRRCRFVVWGTAAAFSTWSLLYTRARNPAAAFGVGLINSWATLWCAVMLVFNDAQVDFRRIERKGLVDVTNGVTKGTNGSTREEKATHANGDGGLRKRNTPSTSNSDPDLRQSLDERKGTLTWQPYPDGPLSERVDWVCDLFSSFRGMGWNFRISGLPPPPEPVQHDMALNTDYKPSTEDTHVSRTGIRRYQSKRELLRYNAFLLCRNYLILDLLKTLIVNDPYFWNGSYSQRPGYLPAWLDAYPVIDHTSRLLISLAAVYYALETIFSLGPLFFVGVLGDRVIGTRGEPWIYCDQFGSFSNVLDHGLAGWWGGWWHQTFRFGFESAADRLIELLGWNKKSPQAKFLKLCVAFTLSGCLHACGSYTQLGDTRPLRGPFTFFVLQAFGVSAQLAATAVLARAGVRDASPRWLRRTANFVYVHVWMYHTAPLLVDDFAKGGIWLFEPLPVSLFRGLGFGAPGDGWFPLLGSDTGGDIVRWHRGDRWWNTGIAL